MKKQLLFNFVKSLSQKMSFRMAAFAVLTLLTAQSSLAQTTYTWGGATSTDFLTGTNWNAVPTFATTTNIYAISPSANNPILNTNGSITTLSCSRVTLSATGATLTTNIPVTCSGTTYVAGGASLTTNANFSSSTSSSNAIQGTVNINAGTFITRGYIQNGGTIVIVAGGTLQLAGVNQLGVTGAGTINVNGGIFNCTGSSTATLQIGALGVLNLNSGTVNYTAATAISISTGGLINIDEGSVIFNGDQTSLIGGHITAGRIKVSGTALANGKVLSNTYNSGTGKTTLTAVAPSNYAPVANNDAITVAPSGTSAVLVGGAASVLTNDTDAESNPLTAIVVTGPANGSLTLNSNGTFSYTHNGSATTSDSFTYKANDGSLDSTPATVTITISSVNIAPVANNDAFSVKQGGTVVTAGATSVLTNDTDAENNPLTATVVTSPANGTLTLNANGTFSYLHNNSATTTDSFTYKANDGTSDSNIATVNITITGPVATTNTWTGGTNTDFLVASNWTASDAPNPVLFGALAAFTIPSASITNFPVLNTNGSITALSCTTLSLSASGSTLTTNIPVTCSSTLFVTGGATLTTNANFTSTVGSANAIQGTINISAGTLNSRFYIQSGGAVVVAAGATLTEAGANRLGVVGAGTLTVNGGIVNCTATSSGSLSIGAAGVLNLNSGTVNYTAATALSISAGGLINIDAGSLIFNGNQTAAVNAFVTAGAIKTSGAALAAGKIISVTYDVDTDKTTVTASATTTWDGSTWSNGVPTATAEAVIAGTYTTSGSGGGFTAKKLTVNSGSLTVNSGTNVTVQNEVINNAGTNGIVVENNANLIQVNGAINTGNVVVNRNSNALYRLDYTMWSSPVANQNLVAFSPLTSQNPSRFYTYDSAAAAYSAIALPALSTTNFAAGTGYLIRMPNTDPTSGYDAGTATLTYPGVFTGVPNNGNVSITLSTVGNAYNLVGNPYPSTINLFTFQSDNSTVVENTFYMWRTTNASGTAYCTYVPSSTTAGTYVKNNLQSPAAFVGNIQSGQAFFVKALTTGPLVFKNAQRVTTSGSFFKTKQVATADKVWLNATNATGDFSQMAVTYFDGATPGVDAFDGKYINDSPLALTSNINNEEYTIQGRPAFDASDVVPLNFKTAVAGDYTIAIDHSEGVFNSGQSVILADAVTGTETDLTTSAYTFTATTGTANSRFSLKYQKTLGTNQAVFSDNNVAVYRSKGTLYVNAGDVTIANIKVYDVQGRLIAELKNVKSTSASINNLKSTNQVLVVKITSQENKVVTKKVVN